VAKREAIEARLQAFLEPLDLDVDVKRYEQAKAQVFARLNDIVGQQQPLSFSDLWNDVNLTASSGFPDFKKKRDLREKAFRQHAKNLNRLSQKKPVKVWPCAMSSRQVIRPRTDENKPRLVWMYPLDMLTLEARYCLPLQRALVDSELFGWHYKWLDGGASWFKLRDKFPGAALYNFDFSSYDSRVASFIIRDVFDWIESRFNSDPIAHAVLKHVQDYFIHTPIQMYDEVYQKHRGIPSGSYFTALVGSIANLILQDYVEASIDGTRLSVCVLGDDSLSSWRTDSFDCFGYPHKFERLARELGQKVNSAKTRRWIPGHNDAFAPFYQIKFLGMDFFGAFPYFKRDLNEVIARVCYPEKEDLSPLHTLIRLHGLVWSFGNCPLVYDYLCRERGHLLVQNPYLVFHTLSSDDKDPEISKRFRYAMLQDIDISTWPSYQTLLNYYFYGYYSRVSFKN